jgi:hypothetical protein
VYTEIYINLLNRKNMILYNKAVCLDPEDDEDDEDGGDFGC